MSYKRSQSKLKGARKGPAISQRRLIHALKTAFCYMPTEEEITEKNYEGDLATVRREVDEVREALTEAGYDPDAVYEELNPKPKLEIVP